MRKILCIVLAVLLLASIGISALADDQEKTEVSDIYVLDYPQLGFHFEIPEKYRNLKGSLDIGAQYLDDGIIQITFSYYSFPPEDFDAYNEYFEKWGTAVLAGEPEPEPPDPRWTSGRDSAFLYEFFSINNDRGEAELREELKEHNGLRGDNFKWLDQIGSDGEFSFFMGQYPEFDKYREEFREVMGDDYFGECEELINDRETFLSAMTLSAPDSEQLALEVGDTVSFTTTDLDGNPVNSGELFAASKVTMINLWATWCFACKKELPDLAEIAKEYEKKGCRVVGICLDADEEGMDELAKEILKENGADYLNLVPPEDVEDLLPTICFPTTFFFDSEGRMISEPVRGAYVEEYGPALDAALEQIG